MMVNSDPTARDVAWLGTDEVNASHAPLLRRLDQSQIRMIDDPERLQAPRSSRKRILKESSGAVIVFAKQPLDGELQAWVELFQLAVSCEMPILFLVDEHISVEVAEDDHTGISFDGLPPIIIPNELLFGPSRVPNKAEEMLDPQFTWIVDRFTDAVACRPASQPYAFMIGRLERDFAHAREAIRSAVETELGITCIWSDDGTHRASIESVRVTTQQLIQHASLVIADLTLGPENPEHENPSRAHEIGMAIAYGKKLMLCSREPRRFPYFSIGDLQMFFWRDEADLEARARAWLRLNRAAFGRRVLNFLLPDWDPTYEPRVRPSVFHFDHTRAYLWRGSRVFSDTETWATALGIGALVLSLGHVGGVSSLFGDVINELAALAVAIVLVWMSRVVSLFTSAKRKLIKAIPQVIVGSAVVITVIALVRSAVGHL